MSSLYRTVTSFIAPPFCGFCYQYLEEYRPLCSTCISSIIPVLTRRVTEQKIPISACGSYEDPLKYLINSYERESTYRLALLLFHTFKKQIQGDELILPLGGSHHDTQLVYYLCQLTGCSTAENKEQLLAQQVILVGAIFRRVINMPVCSSLRVFVVCFSDRFRKKSEACTIFYDTLTILMKKEKLT